MFIFCLVGGSAAEPALHLAGGVGDSLVLVEDLDDELEQVVVELLVVLDLRVLRAVERQLAALPLLIEMVVLDDDDVLAVLDVQVLHGLGQLALQPQAIVALGERLAVGVGEDEKGLDVALGKVYLQEAEVGELLVGQLGSRIDADQAYPGPSVEFWPLLEAADHSRIDELECPLVASA